MRREGKEKRNGERTVFVFRLASSKPEEEPQRLPWVREGMGREARRAERGQWSQSTEWPSKSWLEDHLFNLKV